MKNRLEAELISIAHRILKLKNNSEIAQLQQEALNLYEKLSVLKFVQENYDDATLEIPADIEQKLENPVIVQENASIESKEETIEDEPIAEIIAEETVAETTTEQAAQEIEETAVEEESPTEDLVEEKTESFQKIEDFQVRFEEFEAQLSNAKPYKSEPAISQMLFEDEPVFVPVKNETEKINNTEKTETVVTEIPRNISINDAIKKNFAIGLNDKIAFEFHLFGGKTEEFNRVLSQLNTFDSFAEAKDFILNVVKPDYNNWSGKEEYEERLLEIIESKF